jgi:acyl-CoA synthetase (AMP-forming)/AMP-acid ligase II
MTIGESLELTAAVHGEREALVDRPTGRRWTYAELIRAVDDIALGLLDLDVGKGDRVGIWAQNCAEWVLVQYATARIGAVLVNLNPSYRSHELRFALRHSGTDVLVSAVTSTHIPYREVVEEVRGDCRTCGTSPTSARTRSLASPAPAGPPTAPGWPSGRPPWTSTTRSTSSTRAARPAIPRAPR